MRLDRVINRCEDIFFSLSLSLPFQRHHRDDVSEVNNRRCVCFRHFIRLSHEQIKDVRLSDRIQNFLIFNAPTHRHHSEDFQLIQQTIMLLLSGFLIITWMIQHCRPLNVTVDISDEQRLFHKIMSTYEKSVRPSRRASDPVVVKLGISLTQIMDIVSFPES